MRPNRGDWRKDFPILLRAFARVRQEQPERLIILGEGEERRALTRLADRLGVTPDVLLPGFVSNPFPYMARASVFALSSAWEGPPRSLPQPEQLGRLRLFSTRSSRPEDRRTR